MEAEAGANAAEVDDAAAAVVGEIRERGFDEQQGAQDVDVVHPAEIGRVAGLDCSVLGHAGVVDDHVDLQFAGFGVGKVVQGRRDNVRGSVLGAHVCLHREGFDVVLGLQAVREFRGL